MGSSTSSRRLPAETEEPWHTLIRLQQVRDAYRAVVIASVLEGDFEEARASAVLAARFARAEADQIANIAACRVHRYEVALRRRGAWQRRP